MSLSPSKSTLAVAVMCGVLGSYATACGLPESGEGPDRESSGGGSGSGSSSGIGFGSSSGTSSGSSSGTSSGSSSGNSSGSTSGSGSGGDAGDATDGWAGDNTCYSQASGACLTCCYDDHPAGGNSWDNAFYGCVCDPSNCATQCAQTDCSSDSDAGWPQPGDPCDLCEQQAVGAHGGGACGAAIAAACNPVEDCVALVSCANRCP